VLPSLHAKLSFDPIKDFSPISLVALTHSLLLVNPGVPAKSVKELIALAKAKPGALNFASSGPGSINHFATELLMDAAGIRMTHVPYKGMGPAVTDLIAGHVDVLIASAPSMLQQVRSGKVRGLGVTTLKPSPIAPGLPPLAGAGARGYEVELWWGVLTAAGTPREVVTRLNAEINTALASDEMRGFLLNEGAEPAPAAPEAFAALIRSDIERWKKVAKAADIRPE
jgi:tripartite-type tricarboxylate transporter receptor subunit TctC